MITTWFTNKKLISAILLLGIMLLAFISGPVLAEGNELDFVYGTNHYNGAAYSSAMIPPTVEDIYLIADVENIVAAKFTNVYYWALTNEYKANWDAANEIVEGSLEILKGGELVQTIERSPYVIQYDGLDKYGTIALYSGEDASRARQNFGDKQAAYRDALYDYNEAMAAYREEFEEALEKYQLGLIGEEDFPIQPEKSEDMTLFSTEILEGFVLDLPEGSYTIQLRQPNGTIQTDSIKKLTVFGAAQDGVSYNIFAKERWTTPEISQGVNETIYIHEDNSLYFQPYHSKQYNELYYTRMNDPQNRTARSDRNVWIPFLPVDNTHLIIKSGNNKQIIEKEAFYVKQLLGSALGYQIVEYDPETMTASSFEGYEFQIDVDEKRYFIEMLDEHGEVLTGSYRRIHILSTDRNWIVYMVSILPVAIGIMIVILRRRKVQYIKIVRE